MEVDKHTDKKDCEQKSDQNGWKLLVCIYF